MNDPVVITAHESHVAAVRFGPSGEHLLSSGMDNLVKLWAVPTWELVRTIEGHTKSVNCLSFSPEGTRLATGSTDNDGQALVISIRIA